MVRVTFAGTKTTLELPGICITDRCFKPRHNGEKRCKSCLRARKAAQKARHRAQQQSGLVAA
jgi:hypothetical protein